MRIRTRLAGTTASALVAVLLVGAILLGATLRLRGDLRTKEQVDEAIRATSSLFLLVNDLGQVRSARAAGQLERELGALRRTIEVLRPDLGAEEAPHLATMEAGVRRLADLAGELQGAPAPAGEAAAGAREEFLAVVVGEIFVALDEVSGSAQRLQQALRGRLVEAWQAAELAVSVVLLAALVLVAASTALTSREVLTPLERLSRAVEAVGQGDYGARAAASGTNELATLARAFDEMAAETGRAVGALREEVEQRRRSEAELRSALDRIRTLSGLLPVCASCKKIRDDQGYWQQVDEYLAARTEALVTHSICPQCARTLYPDLDLDGP